MSQITAEDREAIRDGLSRLLNAEAHEEKLRAAMDGIHGYDPAILSQMAEMGLTGITVSEEAGGIGGGAIDACMVMEEVGRKIVPLPYITTCVIGAAILEASDSAEAKALLEDIVAGDATIAIAGTGSIVPLPDPMHSLDAGQSDTLSGDVSMALNGATATHYLIAIEDKTDAQLYLVNADKGVSVDAQQANDPALRPARLKFDKADAVALSGVTATDIENARLRGVAALAAEQAGATRAIFDITIEYLQTRYQFGRPIGSFQALKHMAADLLIEVESATSAARAAALALDSGSENAARSVALAGFICADAFREVSAQAIQMHGGIAYTREHVCHLYWRRARAMQAVLGSSEAHRERYLSTWEAAA